ncbi:hypothetical protein EVAR_22748_1 [Eumeta japonica]|uniref:Uncharacterized protein n=1 Tax=Eumeta variegata TaxID=151549 RepID=A0A4C1UTR1_EUMVA|nr:hypothetical protein EVAR_22748_1 [Eumeta japonica]
MINLGVSYSPVTREARVFARKVRQACYVVAFTRIKSVPTCVRFRIGPFGDHLHDCGRIGRHRSERSEVHHRAADSRTTTTDLRPIYLWRRRCRSASAGRPVTSPDRGGLTRGRRESERNGDTLRHHKNNIPYRVLTCDKISQ